MITSTSAPGSINSAGTVNYSNLAGGNSGETYGQYLQDIQDWNDYNNAWNENQAQKQMDFQAQQNAIERKFNSAEAQKNRDWQENMSNTAHQREVEDLIAAGLNPVLSANNGASVTSGATASTSSANGAKAEADSSGVNALSSWLVNLLNAQTSIMNNMTNAENSRAIAEMNNLTSKDIANLNYALGKYQSDNSRASARDVANIQGSTARDVAKTSALASVYGSDRAYDASVYGSEMSYNSATDSATIAKQGTAGGIISDIVTGIGEGLGYDTPTIRDVVSLIVNLPDDYVTVFGNLIADDPDSIYVEDVVRTANAYKDSSPETFQREVGKSLVKAYDNMSKDDDSGSSQENIDKHKSNLRTLESKSGLAKIFLGDMNNPLGLNTSYIN